MNSLDFIKLDMALTPAQIVHGHAVRGGRTKEYFKWAAMKQRCMNPNNPYYHNYGGRGIIVCERWMKFENFLSDMGELPSRFHTLERIDNDGNYEPENCKWATRREQQNNRRVNAYVSAFGKTMTKAQWSREVKIPIGILSSRLNKLKWPPERALTEPPLVYNKRQ